MDIPRFRVGRLMRLLGAIVCSGIVMSGIAACGADGGGTGEDSPSPVHPTMALSSTTLPPSAPTETEPETTAGDELSEDPTPYLDPSMGSDKPDSDAETTISGTIESGVESGCLILKYEGTVYGIYGSYDDAVVHAGAEVTLHGHLEPGMMTTCQQGTPFVVEEAESVG